MLLMVVAARPLLVVASCTTTKVDTVMLEVLSFQHDIHRHNIRKGCGDECGSFKCRS
jgi:hypothetical protein